MKRRLKTTIRDVVDKECEKKIYDIAYEPTCSVDFVCPFCFIYVKAVKWSLQGTGKSCACGALFHMSKHKVGVVYKLTAYKLNKEKMKGEMNA